MFDVFPEKRRRKQTEIEKIRQKPDCKTIFSPYGKTVFVESGGISGAGFTGILLFVNEVYIELLISIAPRHAP